MKAWMLAAISGTPQLVTQTITASGTVTIPMGVGMLVSLVGKGQDGTPEYQGDWGYQLTVVFKFFRPDGVQDGGGTSIQPRVYYAYPPENDYCTTGPAGGNQGYTREDCYYYNTFDDYQPETTGASATAFGRTFPGGTGGPAASVTFSNVPVTAGQSYNIVIPPGGSITISYYR